MIMVKFFKDQEEQENIENEPFRTIQIESKLNGQEHMIYTKKELSCLSPE